MADEQRPHLHVEFFMDTRLNKRKSEAEGRPIYDDVEKAKIRFAGDKQSVLVVFADDVSSVRDPETNKRLTYKERFPEHYKAFQEKREFHGSGTPLAEAPFITAAKRKEFEASNVFTLEALADLDGTNLQKLGMHAREFKNKAKAYLDNAKGSADVTKLAGENEAMRQQIETMQAQMAELMNAKQTEPAKEQAPASNTPSPFKDWDDETIRLWITEQGGEQPHHKCNHETLVAKADELNATLAKAKEAA